MKKTVRYHRGDSPFKMKSPLKDGEGEKNGSSSSDAKSIPARSGDTRGTYKTTTERVKTNEVAVNPTGGAAKRPMMGNEAYKKYLATETPEKKKKRLEREKKEKVEDASKGKSTATKGGEKISQKSEFVPDKTEKVEGTTSDTFTAEERRIQNRGEKIVNRNERQAGKQALQRDKQYMKNSAEYKSMDSKERAAAKNELKHGQTGEEAKKGSSLDKFGNDFKSRTDTARKMKYGQGENNKAYVDQERNNPGDAKATRSEQYTQGKGWVNSTETQNKANIEKAQAGGKDVKVTKEEKATLPDVARGSSSSSSTKSAENTQEAKPAATQNNKEQSDALQKHKERKPLTPVDSSMEGAPSSVAKMATKIKGFSMKGFGSKAGFNFNKKK